MSGELRNLELIPIEVLQYCVLPPLRCGEFLGKLDAFPLEFVVGPVDIFRMTRREDKASFLILSDRHLSAAEPNPSTPSRFVVLPSITLCTEVDQWRI